ncbi:MAG: Spy/CpxP family protein refolding chaperone [Reyranella sp.]|uniref:Spy/CpxP family protein refolding chaperone n=1 Tax=Reyranella sp. TaxID=1929291 RepID=UPI003D0ED96F
MSFRFPLLALSTALVTAAGLAWTSAPANAAGSGPDDLLELAQTTPPTNPPPGPGGHARHEQREQRAMNPKAFCLDQVARRAGNRAYVKLRLDLKADQMTAWNAFAKASDDADVKDVARCNALPTEMKERPSYIERLTMEESVMKARIERIDAVKPSLQALYDTLSPEQKAVLDSPRPMGGRGGMHHHRGRR